MVSSQSPLCQSGRKNEDLWWEGFVKEVGFELGVKEWRGYGWWEWWIYGRSWTGIRMDSLVTSWGCWPVSEHLVIGVSVLYTGYQSDGAVNSYTTGTTMKDSYRVDTDLQKLACCRPETIYHPDRLQTCIVCHGDTGRDHAPCPVVMYPRPDKPIVDTGYRGPPPAVQECSLYQVDLRHVIVRRFNDKSLDMKALKGPWLGL